MIILKFIFGFTVSDTEIVIDESESKRYRNGNFQNVHTTHKRIAVPFELIIKYVIVLCLWAVTVFFNSDLKIHIKHCIALRWRDVQKFNPNVSDATIQIRKKVFSLVLYKNLCYFHTQ